MKKKFYSWEECMSIREIKALRKVNHPNLIKLLEVIRVNDDLYLIFEYMSQNLHEKIQEMKKYGGIQDYDIRSIMFQSLQGLKVLH